MRVALAGLPLPTTVRVVDRVHGGAADGRLHAAPASGARLAQLLEVVLVVADFADGRAALGRDLAHLAGTQAEHRVTPSRATSCTPAPAARSARPCRASSRCSARWNRPGCCAAAAFAGLDRRVAARDHLVAGLQALRRDDVAALAVGVAQQRDMRGAVRDRIRCARRAPGCPPCRA